MFNAIGVKDCDQARGNGYCVVPVLDELLPRLGADHWAFDCGDVLILVRLTNDADDGLVVG